jgi:UDP-N-acetylglucosamine enolpyruvyl transferase
MTHTVHPKKIGIEKINKKIAEQMAKTRGGIMLMGPLIHEFNSFNLPQAGGCRLGSRTVKPYFYALEKLGVKRASTNPSATSGVTIPSFCKGTRMPSTRIVGCVPTEI